MTFHAVRNTMFFLVLLLGFSGDALAWKQTYKNGSYSGSQRGGKPYGQGIFKWNSGKYAYFKGTFTNGRINGPGTLYYRKGGRCFGKFNNKLKINSDADCRYSNGAKYRGNMQNGKRHLYGRFYYTNGNVYEGKWKFGQKHGKGKLKYNTGSSFIGYWRDGKRYGRGIYTKVQGGQRKYQFRGNYRNGLAQGWGRLQYYESGNYYCVRKVDGKTVEKRRAGPTSSC